jgi:ribosomal protein S18 acetylase RimI-like enzyme
VERTRDDDIARYRQWLDDDPQLDPNLWHLAVEDETVIGACLGTAHWPGEEALAYIFTLGVRPPWRGRGIGRALLQHAFRAFYLADRPSVELDVDAANMTGALRLYEGVGMTSKWQKDFYELELRSADSPA